MSRRIIHTPDAPAAIGTYNQAVQAKGMIFTSGQLGIDPHTGQIIQGWHIQSSRASKRDDFYIRTIGNRSAHRTNHSRGNQGRDL